MNNTNWTAVGAAVLAVISTATALLSPEVSLSSGLAAIALAILSTKV